MSQRILSNSISGDYMVVNVSIRIRSILRSVDLHAGNLLDDGATRSLIVREGVVYWRGSLNPAGFAWQKFHDYPVVGTSSSCRPWQFKK